MLKIEVKEFGKRLDTYLLEKGLSLTRSKIQKLIKDGFIKVCGEKVKPSKKLFPGMVIEIDSFEDEPSHLVPQPIPFYILYEDFDIIVVDKPKNLVVHPSPGHSDATLVNGILFHLGGELPFEDKMSRPGIVHRLDKDTSGVMVVAKNEYAMKNLSEQFKRREVKKEYLALVLGVPGKSGNISAPLGRRKSDRKKIGVVQGGKEAETSWVLEEDLMYVSLLRVIPKSGRTHQIRVHLSQSGYPIVGDKTYLRKRRILEIKSKRIRELILNFKRQALHAYKLSFKHPRTKRLVTFLSPLPKDMERLLEGIKNCL